MVSFVKNVLGLMSNGKTVIMDLSIVSENMNKIATEISNTVLGDYQKLIDLVTEYKLDPKGLERAEKIMTGLGFKGTNLAIQLQMFSSYLKNIIVPGYYEIIDFIEKNNIEHITRDTLSSRDAALVNLIDKMVNTGILAMNIRVAFPLMLDGGQGTYPKQFEDLEKSVDNVYIFITRTKSKSITTILREISELSEESSDEDDISRADANYKGLGDNFTGNPLYHIVAWWEDIKYDRYEAWKNEAALANLKLSQLEMKAESGSTDVSLDKKIKYYSDKVKKLQKKIKDYEEAV